MEYRVHWEIDVEAESPTAAARQALTIQRDPNSTANVFDVCESFVSGAVKTHVDLDFPEDSDDEAES